MHGTESFRLDPGVSVIKNGMPNVHSESTILTRKTFRARLREKNFTSNGTAKGSTTCREHDTGATALVSIPFPHPQQRLGDTTTLAAPPLPSCKPCL